MSAKKGFTLIELLVVIAVIAILLSILIPSMRAAKELASGSVCLSNQRNLCLAWTSYHEDNKAYLVGGSNYYAGSNGTPYRWVEYPLRNDTDNIEVVGPASVAEYSITTRKNGIRAGKLYPYTQDETLYHCPGDKNFTKPEPSAVYRSYAITGLMNGEYFVSRSSGLYSPISVYRSTPIVQGGTAVQLRVAIKFNEIASPGTKHVFVEEDVAAKGQNVNAGGFVLLQSAYNWWDWPAFYHNDSSTIGFADGHAERHRWQDQRTLKLMRYGTAAISVSDASTDNEDLDWMVHGYIPIPPR